MTHRVLVSLVEVPRLRVDREADVLPDETEKYVRLLSDEVIAVAWDTDDVAQLREALRVEEITGWICMCPGDLAIEFVDARSRPLEIVWVDFPASIGWRSRSGNVRLARPERLRERLTKHDIAMPG